MWGCIKEDVEGFCLSIDDAQGPDSQKKILRQT